MEENKKHLRIMKWTARIIALAIILFGLPFYFGYGNPLPFIDSSYSLMDNAWLTIFPLMFIGLGLGWKYEKIGGYLITLPIIIGFVLGILTGWGIGMHMAIALIPGILYLIVGYKKL